MEEFANAFRSHAHENVLEFGRRNEEERNARFASDGSRHEGLAGARRSREKNAARRCGSERIENRGILNGKRGGEGYAEIIDDDFELFDVVFDADHIAEARFDVGFGFVLWMEGEEKEKRVCRERRCLIVCS